jgi:membrane associated rhomboid family serine protease
LLRAEEAPVLQEDVVGQKLQFCIRCGGLMADELGDLCEFCGGEMPPDPPAPTHKPLYRAPLTWSLIALNLACYFAGRILFRDPWDWFSCDGPAVLSGAWWRIATALFTHEGLNHLLDNMFALWLFGRHVERMLGAWTSLALYLACGITGAVVSLAAHPELHSGGASGAIMGLAGALLIAYATRYRILPTRQRWKFWILTAFIVLALVPETAKPGGLKTDLADHLGGFSAGLVLGYVLTTSAAERRAFRIRVMASALAVLVLAALGVREHDAYAVHLEAAERALDRGDEASATRELRVATAMRPYSGLAGAIRERIDSLHPAPSDCQVFLGVAGEPKSEQEACKDIECDGTLHSVASPFGNKRLTYVGHRTGPIPCVENGDTWEQTTASVHVQEFDAGGESVCSTDWNGEWKYKLEGVSSHAEAAPADPLRSFRSEALGRGEIGFSECAK